MLRAIALAGCFAAASCSPAVSSPVSAPPSRTLVPPASVDPKATPVPASIDATGSADASAALVAFLGTVPDGSTIVFRAGGTYRMDHGLKFSNRRDLVFEGNDATLRSNGDAHEASSLFALWGGDVGITIRDFNLIGNSPTPGVYSPGQEAAHGILVAGGGSVDIANVTIGGVWGDCLYVGDGADTVRFHDSACVSAGRNGVSVVAASGVTVESVALDTNGYCAFDIEPFSADQTVSNIEIRDNTVGTWGNIFFAADGVAGSTVNNVTVSGNTVTGGSLRADVSLARRQNITFTNNTSTVAANGPVLTFAHVDNLVVTGNVQPLRSGDLARFDDVTGLVYR